MEDSTTVMDSSGVANVSAEGQPRHLPSYVWKSAYAVLGAIAITVPLGIGFFLYEGIFALLSDAGGLLVGLTLAPLVWGMYLLHQGDRVNLPVLAFGVASVVGICLGSLGLVLMYVLALDTAVVGGTFLSIQFIGWLLLGLWLLGIGWIGLRNESVARRVSWAAMAAGLGAAGGIVTLVYSYAVGSFTLLFPLFMAVFAIGFVVWAFWLGGELRTHVHDEPRTG